MFDIGGENSAAQNLHCFSQKVLKKSGRSGAGGNALGSALGSYEDIVESRLAVFFEVWFYNVQRYERATLFGGGVDNGIRAIFAEEGEDFLNFWMIGVVLSLRHRAEQGP